MWHLNKKKLPSLTSRGCYAVKDKKSHPSPLVCFKFTLIHGSFLFSSHCFFILFFGPFDQMFFYKINFIKSNRRPYLAKLDYSSHLRLCVITMSCKLYSRLFTFPMKVVTSHIFLVWHAWTNIATGGTNNRPGLISLTSFGTVLGGVQAKQFCSLSVVRTADGSQSKEMKLW